MKTLSPKPGKIQQPSPVEDPIRAAFRLLPAAILVLVAGLGPEDREVLAYFVTAPVEDDGLATKEAAAPLSPARRRVGDTAAVWSVGHPPAHGCGCVDCYISFWARWNRSPERNRILDALLAFEEHVAEAPTTPPSSSRRRGRRGRVPAAPPPMPLRRPKSPEPQHVIEAHQVPASAPPPSHPSQAPAEENVVVPEPGAAAECREVAAESGEEEGKRGLADVMGGVLGLGLWGLWSPPLESAT